MTTTGSHPETHDVERDAEAGSDAELRTGSILRSIRIQQGLDLAEIANRTDIRIEHLRSLEERDGSDLPDPAFARPFAFAYALALGVNTVDAEPLARGIPSVPKSQGATDEEAGDEEGWVGELRNGYAWAIVGAITLVAFLFRLPSFTDALFGDELSTYAVVNGYGIGDMFTLIHSDQEATPPLYYLLAWASQHLGDSSTWLRLPSLLAGLAAIPITYLLGLRLTTRFASLVAAAIMALSPFLIFYATEARTYSVSMLMCLVSTYALVRATEDDGERRWWVVYAVFTAAAMYSHYTSIFLLIGQAVWALFARRRSLVPLLVSSAGAVALFLPWLPGYLEDSDSITAHVIEALLPFNFDVFVTESAKLALAGPYIPLRDVPGEIGLLAIFGGCAVGFGAVVVRAWNRGALLPDSKTTLLVTLALAPPLGAGLYSLVSVDVFVSRNLISAFPAWALIAGTLAVAARGWLRIGTIAAVLGGFALGGVMMLSADNQRTDYSSAGEYLSESLEDGDAIVDSPVPAPGGRLALDVALADLDADDLTLHRLGVAPLADRVEALAPGGAGQYYPIEVPSGEDIAGAAIRDAENGRIFLVLGGKPVSLEESAGGEGHVFDFLEGLPAFTVVSQKHFPGFEFGGVPSGVTVYELSVEPR